MRNISIIVTFYYILITISNMLNIVWMSAYKTTRLHKINTEVLWKWLRRCFVDCVILWFLHISDIPQVAINFPQFLLIAVLNI